MRIRKENCPNCPLRSGSSQPSISHERAGNQAQGTGSPKLATSTAQSSTPRRISRIRVSSPFVSGIDFSMCPQAFTWVNLDGPPRSCSHGVSKTTHVNPSVDSHIGLSCIIVTICREAIDLTASMTYQVCLIPEELGVHALFDL